MLGQVSMHSPLLPACSPCSQTIPGSLEPSCGLRQPPACSPCSQLASLAPSLLPLLPEYPWVPGTFLEPQKAPSSLPLLPACFLHSQLAPVAPRASLGPWSELGVSWRKQNVILGPWVPGTFLEPPEAPSLLPLLPACSLHSLLAPLAPRASLGAWSEPNVILGPWVPGTFLEPQDAPSLLPSLPLLPEHPWVPGVRWNKPNVIVGPWVPGTFLELQEAPSSLPLLPACSPHSQLAPLAPRASLGPWSELGARGVSWSKLE